MPDKPATASAATAASSASPSATSSTSSPAAGEGSAATGNGSADPSGLANAPELAMSSLYQSYSHSMGLLYQNAVQAQQQLSTIGQAATVLGVLRLLSPPNGKSPVAANGKTANGTAAPSTT